MPYVNFELGNRIGAGIGNALCRDGLGLAFCQIFNLLLLGGDVKKPLMPNTDPVSARIKKSQKITES